MDRNSPKSLGQHLDNEYLLPLLTFLCILVFTVLRALSSSSSFVSVLSAMYVFSCNAYFSQLGKGMGHVLYSQKIMLTLNYFL